MPGIVYAAGVRHAYNVAKAFQDAGMKASGVSGETPKRELAEIAGGVLEFQHVLLDRAAECGPAYLPGYTHMQRAQPVLLSHHLLAHGWALARDVDRILSTRTRLDVSPLGAGALAGSSLQLDPDVDPDRVNAEFKNGVLTITAAKRPEGQRRVKRIAIPGSSDAAIPPAAMISGEMAVAPREAFLGDSDRVGVEDAVGRISCESIAGYPPGIPALLPGERITTEAIAYLRELRDAGARLHGASDPSFTTITVLRGG